MDLLLDLDKRLLLFARTRGHQPHFESAIKNYSDLGENGLIWIAFALGAAAGDKNGRRGQWLKAAAVPPVTLAVNFVAKNVFRRRRPTMVEPLTKSLTKLSFPSAHASMSFASATVISQLLPKYRRHSQIAAWMMAASRPYLGMHYPSDVVAGAFLGRTIGSLLSRYL